MERWCKDRGTLVHMAGRKVPWKEGVLGHRGGTDIPLRTALTQSRAMGSGSGISACRHAYIFFFMCMRLHMGQRNTCWARRGITFEDWNGLALDWHQHAPT